MNQGYRPDIDGLRCLAVLSVIAYHAASGFIPSGYIGVDVFFVISGFVVTQSLASRSRQGFGKELAAFYIRRGLRLLPALITCLVATAALYTYLAPPTETTSRCFGTSLWALVGLSNWKLAQEGFDYFGVDAELNPFAHTWSLGVEEQFYLLYAPIVIGAMIVSTRFVRTQCATILTAVTITICVSLALFLCEIGISQSYYGTPERIWELACGVGCYFLPQLRHARLSAMVGLVALITLIALPFVTLPRAAATCVAVGVTSVLIFSGRKFGIPSSPASKFLSQPKFLWVGKRSYGLYLWHWPIIVLIDITVGINHISMPIVVATSFVAAALSFRFIETPIRNYGALRTVHVIRTGALLLSAVLLAAALIQFERLELNPSISVATRWGNAFDRGIVDDIPGPVGVPTLTVIGDSHAQMLWPMLRSAAEIQPMSIRNATGSGYLVSENLYFERDGASFEDRPKQITKEFDRLIELREHPSIVLIACRFTSYFEAGGVISSKPSTGWLRLGPKRLRIGSDEALLAEEQSLEYTLERLCRAGIQVILMQPVPELACSPMVGLLVRGQGTLTATIKDQEAFRYRVFRMLERLGLRHPNVHLWNPSTDLVNLGGGAFHGDILLYRDNNHLSSDGALRLLPGFLAVWAKALETHSNNNCFYPSTPLR